MAKYLRKTMQETIQNLMRNGWSLRRIGQGHDIGELCVFLASEDASFINGADIPIDGGVSCKLARSSR